MEEYESLYEEGSELPIDSYEAEAYELIEVFFQENRSRVFYGRQIEIIFEDKFFHWVTNRVLRILVQKGKIFSEVRSFTWGGSITLYWNKSFRYYRREAQKVVELVQKYSEDRVGSSVGSHGELLVIEGFAKIRFTMAGRNVNEYKGFSWESSGHNLDMIFERDGIGYGVEVKNTLGYMDNKELESKIELCRHLEIKPVFVVRMLPKSWIHVIGRSGGFALILKHLLYPEYLGDLALAMKNELGLPVETPKSLREGTMRRFEKWHENHVNWDSNSQ